MKWCCRVSSESVMTVLVICRGCLQSPIGTDRLRGIVPIYYGGRRVQSAHNKCRRSWLACQQQFLLWRWLVWLEVGPRREQVEEEHGLRIS